MSIKKRISRRRRRRLAPPVLPFIKNPNPVTYTTEMLICRYHFEGMPLAEISVLLGRTEEEIEGIVAVCRDNGNYRRYNLFGRGSV